MGWVNKEEAGNSSFVYDRKQENAEILINEASLTRQFLYNCLWHLGT